MQSTHAPIDSATLLKGTWRYLGGIPGWDSWGTLEKKCEYVLSEKSLVINRRDASLPISLSAMQGVSLDCRWSRPRFLINYAVSGGTSHLAVFEFHQALRASASGKRLLLRLLELGVKPDTTLAGETAETLVAQPSPSPAAFGQAVTRSGPTESQATTTREYSNWVTDPLAVYRSNASPTLVRMQGFAIGFFLSIIGVIVVLVLSDERKQGDRAFGALAGMVVWLGLMWFMGAFDPWLVEYGLNAHDCYQVFGETTCTGPWSLQ